MVCFALVQASHSNTTCSLPFYIHITCLVNPKVNSAFLQPIYSEKPLNYLFPLCITIHKEQTYQGKKTKQKKMRKEKKKFYKEKWCYCCIAISNPKNIKKA